MRIFIGLLATVVLAFGAVATPANAGETRARVIVQLRPDATLLATPLLAGANGVARTRAEVLTKRTGIELVAGAEIGDRMQVVHARGMTSDELARRLASDPDVEWAVPDHRRRVQSVPNDPFYGAGVPGSGPAVGQWYLRPPAGEVASSIDAERAWDVTTGDPGVVVAVLDTGVRFDHPDLRSLAAGGSLLPGYDMVSDPDIANDGDGRDADASDPGDWLTAAELSQVGGPFEDCDSSAINSSWHGTKVSGLIAALTNNGIGMASVGRNIRVLPVRVLGKCGGFDSDVIAGMRWAAGLVVPGTPPNPTPARVLNLSLGGEGSCTLAQQSAVSEVLAAGAVVVASAGNEAGHAVGSPGNCIGAIAVTALRHAGTKVGFSNLGPEATVGAPGGNCVNIAAGAPCLYPILTTSNDGTTVPGNATYSDSIRPTLGTSFSAPLVAGTAALMFSVRPSLTPAQLHSMLRGTSRLFVATSSDPTVPRCTAPQYSMGTPVDQLECICTSTTCGAGMLDAGAAVLAAKAGVQIAPVVEFYHQVFDHYFITWDPDEIAALDAGTQIRGWTRTNETFLTWTTPEAGSSPVCRYYIPPGFGDSHFFGRDGVECEASKLHSPHLRLEAARFMHMMLPTGGNCPGATVPVYRVYSDRPDANHRYMTNRALRDQMVAKGWRAEGDGPDVVAMCAPR